MGHQCATFALDFIILWNPIMKEFITSFARAGRREREGRNVGPLMKSCEWTERKRSGVKGEKAAGKPSMLSGLGWGPESPMVDMLPSQQLDLKEQIRSYFRMLFIPNGNFWSHSFHMKFIKEHKKYFQG